VTESSFGGAVLAAEGVVRRFRRRGGGSGGTGRLLTAVAGVSLAVGRAEIYALVGRSGAGKTTLGKILCGLDVPDEGRVLVEGRCLVDGRGRVDGVLRRRVQMVFQDAGAAMDPLHSVRRIVAEPLLVAGALSRRQRLERVGELLAAVELPNDDAFLAKRPRQLSGGERQRVVIARALACEPRALVLDEPVSALDAAIRGQVLELLAGLAERFGLAEVLIAHDLEVVRRVAHRVGVMLGGRLVEEGPVGDVLASPRHPATLALLEAAALHGAARGEGPGHAGERGCPFRHECPRRMAACEEEPPRLSAGDGRTVACHAPLPP